MKTAIIFRIILLMSYLSAFSQEAANNGGSTTNEAIQQIQTPSIDDILVFQTLNRSVGNYVFTQQAGKENQVSINQQNETRSTMSNQAYTFQNGNSNELTIEQNGTENLLIGFQLGFITNTFVRQQNMELGDLNYRTEFIPDGDRNKIMISQKGSNNGVMAIQEGTDNFISANQNGSNNYLFALQKGENNSVRDYKQENMTVEILYDKIIQVGDNLSLKTDLPSSSSLKGNTFLQTGTNLSLEITNNLLNTLGGVEVNQKGSDMRVIIDQSYFSFPLR